MWYTLSDKHYKSCFASCIIYVFKNGVVFCYSFCFIKLFKCNTILLSKFWGTVAAINDCFSYVKGFHFFENFNVSLYVITLVFKFK